MSPVSKFDSISPFFIVGNLSESVDFYKRLGFQIDILVPDEEPFFAIVSRDNVSLQLKEISPDISPEPNSTRHEWARWDAFIRVSDPDSLSSEFQAAGLPFHEPLQNTEDGLRAFEIKDNNGYVLCFARPL